MPGMCRAVADCRMAGVRCTASTRRSATGLGRVRHACSFTVSTDCRWCSIVCTIGACVAGATGVGVAAAGVVTGVVASTWASTFSFLHRVVYRVYCALCAMVRVHHPRRERAGEQSPRAAFLCMPLLPNNASGTGMAAQFQPYLGASRAGVCADGCALVGCTDRIGAAVSCTTNLWRRHMNTRRGEVPTRGVRRAQQKRAM